jgi:hypothetical protein
MIADKLGSYAAAQRQIMPEVEHHSHKGVNSRAENSRLPPLRFPADVDPWPHPLPARRFRRGVGQAAYPRRYFNTRSFRVRFLAGLTLRPALYALRLGHSRDWADCRFLSLVRGFGRQPVQGQSRVCNLSRPHAAAALNRRPGEAGLHLQDGQPTPAQAAGRGSACRALQHEVGQDPDGHG